MKVDSLPEEFPPSNIDSKRKETTHISAWADKDEFISVFNRIFEPSKAPHEAKTSALGTLKVWKIRQGRQTPVSVLCTITILEAQLYDEKNLSQDGASGMAHEVKSMYAGAFTRFINHLTEYRQQSGAGNKGSMANRVKEIGIEGYFVELRHLCAHSSMSIAVDVFRRSADYCMNWLKVCYWMREKDQIQSCDKKQIKGVGLGDKFCSELEYIAKVYDITTKAIHKGAKSLSGAEKDLTPAQFQFLQEHVRANKVDQLNSVVFEVLRYLSEIIQLPKHPETVPTVCNIFLESCQYMFEAPVSGNTQGLANIHQRFFQTLVAKGYIQLYWEKLMEICEDEEESVVRRQGAKFWATEIALAFRLLKKFKKILQKVPGGKPQFNRKEFTRKMSKTVRAIYQNKLRVDLHNTVVLGMSVNCPWHLRLSRTYIMARIMNVNAYTKEILPIILALAEPHLSLNQRETIEAATEKYTMNYLSALEDGAPDVPVSSTPKRPSGGAARRHEKIYTLDDVLRQRSTDGNDDAPSAKKPKQLGVWKAVDNEDLDWGKCPLGKLVWD
ncbi:uncharacterized protein LOC134218408 [Armigeres subalbatus]|uniref:uncharacterized protein LOC134218408 n=1 Tax=Armigeres subalbatus TaxID=124917 RepID=UPI002ED11F33